MLVLDLVIPWRDARLSCIVMHCCSLMAVTVWFAKETLWRPDVDKPLHRNPPSSHAAPSLSLTTPSPVAAAIPPRRKSSDIAASGPRRSPVNATALVSRLW